MEMYVSGFPKLWWSASWLCSKHVYGRMDECGVCAIRLCICFSWLYRCDVKGKGGIHCASDEMAKQGGQLYDVENEINIEWEQPFLYSQSTDIRTFLALSSPQVHSHAEPLAAWLFIPFLLLFYHIAVAQRHSNHCTSSPFYICQSSLYEWRAGVIHEWWVTHHVPQIMGWYFLVKERRKMLILKLKQNFISMQRMWYV